jgi:ATP-independent RNA helicase DbpA
MNFKTLALSDAMQKNLKQLNYLEMTAVQQKALPLILEGADVVAKAKTGSGKSAAFGIGIIEKLTKDAFETQSLILAPTRELADQLAKELRRLARAYNNIKVTVLSGGASYREQLASLRHPAHIVVATPGRLLKHLREGNLLLDTLKVFVLDEADRMLDMGFEEELNAILYYIPKGCQTLLFSATYTSEIEAIAKKILHKPLFVDTKESEQECKIEEIFYMVNDKSIDLLKIVSKEKPSRAILFVNTKVKADEIAQLLLSYGIDAVSLHGDLEQYERFDVLVEFGNGSAPILVATDVAARGLDIKDVSLVINVDLPSSVETYIHRIGRTARAGAIGKAISLCENEDEVKLYKERENIVFLDAATLNNVKICEIKPAYKTIVIEGGKKDKLRAGDILGALSGDGAIDAKAIGKIDIYERQSYVAVKTQEAKKAFNYLQSGKIKRQHFSVFML